jgi:hypothetical protein
LNNLSRLEIRWEIWGRHASFENIEKLFFKRLPLPLTHANHAFPALSDGRVLSLIPQLGILRLLP